MPFPAMSPQDALLQLGRPPAPPGQEFHGSEPRPPFPGHAPLPPHPMAAQHLMGLNSPAAQAALLSR